MKAKIYYLILLSLVFCRQNQFRDTEYSLIFNKGYNKITEYRAIFQRQRQISQQTDKISQQLENWENRNGPDLVQAFPKTVLS